MFLLFSYCLCLPFLLGDPWIAVGYENGHIAIFDWTTGNEVKTIVDANSSPLTHLSFSTANTVLAMDSGGQLFRISITKMFFIFSAEVEKIATIRGSGPISTCAALPEGVKPHPSDFFSLVAFGTYRRVMISSLHPRMEMKHTVEAPAHGMEEVMKKKGAGAEAARPSTLSQSKSKLRLRCFPHISWRPARPTTDSKGKMEDPILAIGWGNQVQLLKAVVVNSLGKNAGRTSMGMREVSKTTATSRGGTSKGVVQHQEEEGGEDIAFENISFFFTSDESVAKCYICGVRWLSPQVLLVVNSRKELQLWDPFGGGKLDLFDFTFMRVAGMNLVLLPSAKKTLGGEEEEEFAKTKANLSLRIDMSVQTSYTATTDNEDDEENIEDDAEDNVDSDVDDVREAPESNLDRAIRISYEPHIAVCKGRVYVLGEKTMYCGHLLRWQERVEALQTANNFEGALALLLALHEGSANALISRTAGAQARLRHRTAEYMEGMLRESVASVLNARPKHEKILQIVQQLVHYSKAIDRPQLITVFFNEFVKKHQSDVFLEAIVPLILKKKLEALSPEVMKALIIYFEQKEDFDALESCICNLDYTTLDIDATVRLCRQFHLPTALTYVYTNVMQDFIGPIETFLPLLIRTRDRLNMNKSENSNHNPYPASVLKQRIAAAGPFVLQYIKVTLDGATLSGELMEEKRQEVARTQVLQYLFTKKELATSSSSLTSPSPSLGSSLSNREIQLHFDAKGSAVSSYQALRVLLAYDTSGCLDALSPAFNNPSLSDTAVPFATDVVDSQSSEISSSSPSLEGLTPEVSSSGYSSAASDGSLPPEFQKRRGRRGRGSTSRGGERSRKREKKPSSVSVGHTAMVAALVSILFDVGVEPYHVESFKLRVAQQVEEEEQEMRKGIQPKSFDCKFTMAQEASLHHYLARYYNAGVIPLPDEVLKYSFGFLCCVDYDHGSRMSLKEREESMLLLIQSCPLDRLMSDRLLAIVEKAKFYRVLKMLYVFARQFGRAIQAHLVATNSNSSIFLFLRELLAKFDKGQEGPKLREEVLKFVSDLLAINSEQASQLLVTYFLSEHRRVMDQLQNKPRLQYDYLRLVERSTEISEQEHELLIRLMCEYDPARVYDHLASHDEYRPLICLEIVSKYNLPDSKAYLLEKTGDYTAALEILTESLSDCLEKVKLCCKDVDSSSSFTPLSLMEKRTLSEQSNTESDSIVLASNVLHLKQAVEDCVAASKKCENLCKRASIKFGFEEDDNYSMWFKFLDTLLESMVSCREWIRHPPYVSRYGQLVISSIAGLTKAALAGAMSAGVMPARLLQNVIAGYGADTQLTHFADVISSMFENYKYELSILETTNRLLETDTHFATKFLLSNRQKAFVVQPKDRFCAVCEQPFQEAVPVDLRMKWKCHASENADSAGGSQFTTTVQDDSGAGMWHKRNEDEERGVVMRCFSKCGHVVHPSCMFVSSSTANIPCPACTVSARTSSASLVESNHKSKFSRLAPSVPTQLAMERLSGYEEKSKYVREEEVRHLRYVFG